MSVGRRGEMYSLKATTKALMAEVRSDFSEGSVVAFSTFCGVQHEVVV